MMMMVIIIKKRMVRIMIKGNLTSRRKRMTIGMMRMGAIIKMDQNLKKKVIVRKMTVQ